MLPLSATSGVRGCPASLLIALRDCVQKNKACVIHLLSESRERGKFGISNKRSFDIIAGLHILFGMRSLRSLTRMVAAANAVFLLLAVLALSNVSVDVTAASAASGVDKVTPISDSISHHARHILHTRTSSPTEWIRTTRSVPSTSISFVIALRQQNLVELESMYWRVSNPRHVEYGQYKSIDEIDSLIAPKKEDRAAVHKWLIEHGITDDDDDDDEQQLKIHSDAIEVRTTVHQAESLLHTQFFDFHHREKKKMKLSCAVGDYSIPLHLKEIIDMIEGVSSFPIPHFKVNHPHSSPFSDHTNEVSAASINVMVPQGIYQAYNITQTENGQPNLNSSVGVIQFILYGPESYSPSDLALFGQEANLPVLPVQQVVGPNNATNPEFEPTLDIQMISGVNLAGQSWFWTQPNPGSWLYTFSLTFFDTAIVPLVISLSYGFSEEFQCRFDQNECNLLGIDNRAYIDRVSVEFQKIGLRGISILVASGDDGVHNDAIDPDCTYPTFLPDFPSTSPYVTSVGATEFVNVIRLQNPPPACNFNPVINCIGGGDEQAVSHNVSHFASGGGFSNITLRPSYQDSAVTHYLQSVTLPPSSYYNQLGRAYPDISAIGANLAIVHSGQTTSVSGTSASAPILAAMFSLINSELMGVGRPRLGPLNQLLYQMSADDSSTFTDIVTGDNKCPSADCPSTCQGFYATEGWDPVSGLGTPRYEAMLSYIMNDLSH